MTLNISEEQFSGDFYHFSFYRKSLIFIKQRVITIDLTMVLPDKATTCANE